MPSIFLLYAMFASVFIFGKNILHYTTPLFAVGFRMTLAGFFFLTYLYFFQRKQLKFSKQQWKSLIYLSIFNIFLTNALEFWALKYLDAAKTCFLYSLAPFFSTILSYFFFQEKATFKKWIGLFLGMAGFFPIIIGKSDAETNLVEVFSFFSMAEFAMIGATIATALGWIYLRKLIQMQVTPLAANGVSMFIGGILSLITSRLFDTWDPTPVTNWPEVIEYSIMIGLISNLCCYNLYGHLLKKFTASFLSFCGFVTPMFTAILGYIFLNEVLTWHFAASSIIVFSGLVLFYFEDLKMGYFVKK